MDGDELKYIRRRLDRTAKHVATNWLHISSHTYKAMEQGTIEVSEHVAAEMLKRAAYAGIPPFGSVEEPVVTPAHLKAFRKKYKLTQEEAASFVLRTAVAWHHWETGKAKIPVAILYALKDIAKTIKERK